MRALTVVGLLALAVSAVAEDQVVREMTPERIAEAVAYGKKVKNENGEILEPYLLQDGDVACGYLSTPFLRVASVANRAAKAYSEPTDQDIKGAIEGDLVISAPSKIGKEIRDVVTIVVATTDDASAEIIKPTEKTAQSDEYVNGFGRKTIGTSMKATFPLSVLQAGRYVRIVYTSSPECRPPILMRSTMH